LSTEIVLPAAGGAIEGRRADRAVDRGEQLTQCDRDARRRAGAGTGKPFPCVAPVRTGGPVEEDVLADAGPRAPRRATPPSGSGFDEISA